MKSLLPFLTLVSLLSGSVRADEIPQPQASFTPAGSGEWDLSWNGVSDRTYFIQWSLDLLNWDYAPVIDFGENPDLFGTDTEGATKYFVRLKYVDYDWVDDRAAAETLDFDGDGIPNLFEVETVGSDPFDKESAGGDSDNAGMGDGMADGWELYHFGNLTTADPNAKLSPDGLTNKEKSELGLGPFGDDVTAATERITYSYDGERLDGVNYYTQREFAYGLDGNGNIETTTSN